MKSTFLLLMIVFLVASCGTSESIRSKYLYSDKVKEVLTDEEYYKLDKEAKWPLVNHNNICIVNERDDNSSLDIKEALSKK